MIVMFCDRCGKKIDQDDHWWYTFKIDSRPNTNLYDFEFELCQECSDKVVELTHDFIASVKKAEPC